MGNLYNKMEEVPLDPPRVVVRYHEDWVSQAEMSEDTLAQELGQRFPDLRSMPVFSNQELDVLAGLVQEAKVRDETYQPIDFAVFRYLDAPPGPGQVDLAKELLRSKNVQDAYIARVGPDPSVNATDDPRSSLQGYLDPAPIGVNVRYAWKFAGGDGADQRLIDLERGWTLNHEDLSGHNATLLHGAVVNTARAHGTAVLGIICAADNSLGTVGIVPNLASVRVVSHQNSTLSQALLAAVAHLVAGDTLLLEVQVELNGTGLLGPVDAYACEWELVRMATALGIVVVEAGGNGTENGLTPALDLNSYTTLSGVQLLNRDPADRSLHDSGAIIVTAATSTEPHTRLDYAPHGRRIDCFAWGENIHTLNSDSQGATALYTPRFDGTSGAAAIIAGVALAVQGYVQTLRGKPINPLEMRDLLSDPSPGFNTPAALTETTPIGVMPNLRSIFDRLTNGVP